MNGATLDEAVTKAAEAHPEIAFDAVAFAKRLLEAAKNDSQRLAQLNTPDLLLAFAALRREPKAEAELDRRLVRATHAALGGRLTDPHAREEVVQLVRDRIFVGAKGTAPRLARFDGTGSLVSWMKVVALSVAVDFRRRDKADLKASDSALMAVASSEPAGDEALGRARHRAAFTAAFKDATAALDGQQRMILRMRYVDQVAIEDVGRAFNVHRTTAMRWLEKAQADLLAGVRERLRLALGLGARELDSLLKVMQPSLAERLSRVLAAVTDR
jgi:RNA polymerase sigma-70 factor (ECF subfamily)